MSLFRRLRAVSRNWTSPISMALLASLAFLAAQASATPVLAWDISSGTITSLVGTPRANGAQFSVSSATFAVSLGMWDEASNGLLNTHPVQLWTDSGTLLASATVTNASTAVSSAGGAGRWLFSAITPISLSPGTYRIAVGYGVDTDDPVRFGTTVVTSIGAQYILEAFSAGGAGTTAFPSNLLSNPLFGANLQLDATPANAIPEPGTAALTMLVLGIAAWRRRRV